MKEGLFKDAFIGSVGICGISDIIIPYISGFFLFPFFTASLAVIVKNKVMVDCDVDAANLYILLHPEIKKEDVFSSHRPYRGALGIESALKEIEAKKGLCYDEKAVDACKELFKMGFRL